MPFDNLSDANARVLALEAGAADRQAALNAKDAERADLIAAHAAALTAKDAEKATAVEAATATATATAEQAAAEQIAALQATNATLAAQLAGGTTPVQVAVPAVTMVALQIEAEETGRTVAEVWAEHSGRLVREVATAKQAAIFARGMAAFPTRPPQDQFAILTRLGLTDYAGLPAEAVGRVMSALALPAYLALDRAGQTAVIHALGL